MRPQSTAMTVGLLLLHNLGFVLPVQESSPSHPPHCIPSFSLIPPSPLPPLPSYSPSPLPLPSPPPPLFLPSFPPPVLQDLSHFEALCQQLYDPTGGLAREAEKALLQFAELPNVLQQCQVILEQTQVGVAGGMAVLMLVRRVQ